MSFAVLPESTTKNMNPMDTPFGAHTWNATVYEYFPLAARLGIRRCLVFWDWPNTAPYTPEFDEGSRRRSRLEWPKRFGLAPYGVLYPVIAIEHRENKQYTDEALRAGVRQSIEKYKKDGLWGFQIGNEPPGWNPEMVKRDVEAYKAVYEEIKKTDPSVVAIGSAIGPSEDFFKAGFQHYQDAYNLHAYSDLGTLRAAMKQYKELFKKYGGEKPIWSTEIGSKGQGLPRDVIARDILQKMACFQADGGGFFTWFAVGGMPDPEGERTGTYSDSMDLFAAKYNMHLPRLDAVAFYHLVNTFGAKKFVEEKNYGNGTAAFLFRDQLGNALQILWNPLRVENVFLPLPDIHEVTVTQMNGNIRRFDAEGQGIHLRIGEDPVMVTFRDDRHGLPAELKAPDAFNVEGLPESLTQGQVFEVTVRGTGPLPGLKVPFLWDVPQPGLNETKGAAASSVSYRVKVPEDTSARKATLVFTDETVTEAGNTELRYAIPVTNRIQVDVLPVAGEKEGDAEVKVVLSNHGTPSEKVDWQLELLDELPMEGGTYRLPNARPSSVRFGGQADGSLTLKGGERREIAIRLEGADRQTIYNLRASVKDSRGDTLLRERRAGGFARAVKAAGPIALDGQLDEDSWKRAPVYRLDEARQFCVVEKDARPWAGRDDLSGTMQLAWDEKNLYVAVRVKDDIFANPKSDDRLWEMDGLQFLFDPYRSAPQTLGRYDYALGDGQKGLQAWRHMSASPSAPSGPAPEIKFFRQPSAEGRGDCVYEVAIPWAALAPFQPAPGGNLGFTMLLNEHDGTARKSTIGWFGGVHLKETLYVGDLILSP